MSKVLRETINLHCRAVVELTAVRQCLFVCRTLQVGGGGDHHMCEFVFHQLNTTKM